jgi:hypothetical protein
VSRARFTSCQTCWFSPHPGNLGLPLPDLLLLSLLFDEADCALRFAEDATSALVSRVCGLPEVIRSLAVRGRLLLA